MVSLLSRVSSVTEHAPLRIIMQLNNTIKNSIFKNIFNREEALYKAKQVVWHCNHCHIAKAWSQVTPMSRCTTLWEFPTMLSAWNGSLYSEPVSEEVILDTMQVFCYGCDRKHGMTLLQCTLIQYWIRNRNTIYKQTREEICKGVKSL